MHCRVCKEEKLVKFLDLGFTPLADQFLDAGQLNEPEVHYPLDVMLCENCGLVQLGYVVPPEILYKNDYPYESSITNQGRLHWKELAKTVKDTFGYDSKQLVIDIGSNVGVLLEEFRNEGFRILGIEPAPNIAKLAEERGVETINNFIGVNIAQQIVKEKGKAQFITATNVFAHIDDLDSFVNSIKILLEEKGILVIEAPYLLKLLSNIEYDTIYHEHLSYLSLKPLMHLFKRFEMEVVHVEEREIHGGTFRVYIARNGQHRIKSEVAKFLEREERDEINSYSNLFEFAKKVEKQRADLTWMINNIKQEGKRIAVVSAPAKGMTLLNYCHLGKECIDFATEKSKLKIGKFTPGMHIPVVTDDELINKMPEYALILAWNFADEIMANLSEYKKRGGRFIIPIPSPHIV